MKIIFIDFEPIFAVRFSGHLIEDNRLIKTRDKGQGKRKTREIRGLYRAVGGAPESDCSNQILRRCTMKGYVTEGGYMGYVNDHYVLFSSERDYIEWMED